MKHSTMSTGTTTPKTVPTDWRREGFAYSKEMQVTMKTLRTQIRHSRQIMSWLMRAFVFAVVITVLAMTPAIADGHGHHYGWGHGWHGERYGHYGEWHGYRPPYDYWRPPQPHPVIYAPPPVIYAPPPVYYPPLPSPGINLIFPIHIR